MMEYRLVSVPVSFVNRPGGGGAVALVYLNQHADNGHYLYAASQAVLSAHILGTTSVSYTDITPVAHMYGEYIGAGVKIDSAIKSARDLIERLRNDPSAQTAEWKQEVEKIHGTSEFMGSAQLLKLMETDYAQTRALFASLGLVK